jgi:hypothetical protein
MSEFVDVAGIPQTGRNGLSRCCNADPYRMNSGPWRCGQCYQECERYMPQRQDSLTDQLVDIARLADRMGCYDAADWIRNQL